MRKAGTMATIKRLFEEPRAGWDALTDLLGFALAVWAIGLALSLVL